MLYFLSARRNPTRWNYLWPGNQSPEEHQALIEQARADPPAAAVIAGRPKLRSYAPAIVDYLDDEYETAYDGDQLTLYVPSARK